jgi:hypothetical protein
MRYQAVRLFGVCAELKSPTVLPYLNTIIVIPLNAEMMPEIEERYAEYRPPFDVATVVRELIDPVREKYTRGLKKVLLVNSSSLSRRDRVGKVWSRKRKRSKQDILGRYHHNNGAAWIEIRVDKTVESWKATVPALFWIPGIRYLCIAQVLYHELGHHIHQTIRPEFCEREDVADRWRVKLSVNFIRKRYWYFYPCLRLLGWVYRKMKFNRGKRA